MFSGDVLDAILDTLELKDALNLTLCSRQIRKDCIAQKRIWAKHYRHLFFKDFCTNKGYHDLITRSNSKLACGLQLSSLSPPNGEPHVIRSIIAVGEDVAPAGRVIYYQDINSNLYAWILEENRLLKANVPKPGDTFLNHLESTSVDEQHASIVVNQGAHALVLWSAVSYERSEKRPTHYTDDRGPPSLNYSTNYEYKAFDKIMFFGRGLLDKKRGLVIFRHIVDENNQQAHNQYKFVPQTDPENNPPLVDFFFYDLYGRGNPRRHSLTGTPLSPQVLGEYLLHGSPVAVYLDEEGRVFFYFFMGESTGFGEGLALEIDSFQEHLDDDTIVRIQRINNTVVLVSRNGLVFLYTFDTASESLCGSLDTRFNGHRVLKLVDYDRALTEEGIVGEALERYEGVIDAKCDAEKVCVLYASRE